MLYFAYGSNMDPAQMARRCPDSSALGGAILRGYRLTFTFDSERWAGGVGNVVADPDEHVWGVLWDLSIEDESSLDEYESVNEGIYTKTTVTVDHEGRELEAMIYLATDTAYVGPSARYLHALIRGARAHQIPEYYVDRLVGLLPEFA